MTTERQDVEALAEFLLSRYAEDEALLEREDRVYGGGGEVWTVDAHDRARAELKAKRRIVEQAMLERERLPSAPSDPERERSLEALEWACSQLASVYADHPDCREEWKP